MEARRRTASSASQSSTIAMGDNENGDDNNAMNRIGNRPNHTQRPFGSKLTTDFRLTRRGIRNFALGGMIFLLVVHLQLARVAWSVGGNSIGHALFNAEYNTRLAPLSEKDREQYTIRINTWKRTEELLVSLRHHSTCPGVAQIQIVWCTEQGEPPAELVQLVDGSKNRVVIERHKENSLNERFRLVHEPPTLGILSMDDDVLRPCHAIDAGKNQRVLCWEDCCCVWMLEWDCHAAL